MACGCGKPNPSVLLSAAMCGACQSLDRPGMVVCTIDGKPSLSRPCPIGKHADKDGVVRWAGLEWHGMPYPIRLVYRWSWLRWLTGVRNPRLANLKPEGCGCCVGLKDAVGAKIGG